MRAVRGHDLALYAAGVTFYAAIGFVPLLLLALYLAGLLAGAETVRSLAYDLTELLPSNLGAQDAGHFLAAAVSLGWVYLLHVVVLMGYVVTLRIDARDGHPLQPPADQESVQLHDSVRSPSP